MEHGTPLSFVRVSHSPFSSCSVGRFSSFRGFPDDRSWGAKAPPPPPFPPLRSLAPPFSSLLTGEGPSPPVGHHFLSFLAVGHHPPFFRNGSRSLPPRGRIPLFFFFLIDQSFTRRASWYLPIFRMCGLSLFFVPAFFSFFPIAVSVTPGEGSVPPSLLFFC